MDIWGDMLGWWADAGKRRHLFSISCIFHLSPALVLATDPANGGSVASQIFISVKGVPSPSVKCLTQVAHWLMRSLLWPSLDFYLRDFPWELSALPGSIFLRSVGHSHAGWWLAVIIVLVTWTWMLWLMVLYQTFEWNGWTQSTGTYTNTFRVRCYLALQNQGHVHPRRIECQAAGDFGVIPWPQHAKLHWWTFSFLITKSHCNGNCNFHFIDHRW